MFFLEVKHSIKSKYTRKMPLLSIVMIRENRIRRFVVLIFYVMSTLFVCELITKWLHKFPIPNSDWLENVRENWELGVGFKP